MDPSRTEAVATRTGEVQQQTRTTAAPSVSQGSTSQDSTEATAAGDVDPEQYQLNIGACMAEKGWEAQQDEGINQFAVPDEQQEQFLTDHEDCTVSFGYPVGIPSYTAEEADAIYDELLALGECVEDHGHPMDEPPSRALFVEGLVANPVPIWHPYDLAAEGGRLTQVERDCPVGG